ncbi:MAG TPA: hypothetical protein VGC95_10965, partial [Chitinophagaceae bacterium]
MKNTVYSLGITLFVGCHVTAEKTAPTQPAEYGATTTIQFQPLAPKDSAKYYSAVRDFFERSLIANRNFNGG